MKITSYKKDGKTYYKFNIYLGRDEFGKEIRTNRQGFVTKKDAQIEYLRLKENGLDKLTDVDFDNIFSDWVKSYKLTVKPSTYERMLGMYRNHIQPEFGNMVADKITTSMIQKFVNDKSKEQTKFGELLSVIRRVYNYAIVNKKTVNNPALGIILPRKESKLEDDEFLFYEVEELKEFLNHAETSLPLHQFAFLRLMAYTGMRRGEVLALTRTDVLIDTSQVRINKTLSRGIGNGKIVNDPKTFQGRRIVDIDRETLQVLIKLMESHGNEILFPNNKGNYFELSTPIKWMDAVIEKHGLKRITLHGLRHTHCSLLFAAGASVKEVQHQLGHTDIKTTLNIYAHVTKNQKLETVNKFVKLME
ncbi:MAG: site-specific integrase [Tissierellia bacterium]|nr:site-specific integrase [Tissierellia bacterium]